MSTILIAKKEEVELMKTLNLISINISVILPI